MTYKRVEPYTKEEAEAAFAQGDSQQITDALLGVTYYEEDWRWVQNACLSLLECPETQPRWIAIQCLGHLATFHGVLDLEIVIPAVQAQMSEPKLSSVFYDALGDMARCVDDTSYYEDNWDTLPHRIKDALIANGIFNSQGKRVRKRNFSANWEETIPEQGSHDQEIVERLKQRYAAFPSHDWQEYYDEQGNLLRFSLAELELVDLPPELWQLTSLLELDLSVNQLSSLPVELGQLVNLERLDIGQNKFCDLPAELGQLTNLQELYLDENQLYSFPAVLGELISLQTLHLSENHLSEVPAELGQLTNLLTLYLDKNQLRGLPVELGQLINLRTLILSQNQLSSLPAELGQLINLHWLDLDQNHLISLPTELGQLTSLYTLDLRQNPQLQNPPPEIVQQGEKAVLAYLRALL